MRQKSDGWQRQMQKAYADLNGLHLPVTSLKSGAQVLVLETKTATTGQANTASALCARLPRCKLQPSDGQQTLGTDATAFIQSQIH
jgi:hypothetical protein